MSDTRGSSTKAAVANKVLVPLVAAGASAAAGYVAKRAPKYLEKTVLPRLREASQTAGGAAQDLPAKAKAAVGGTGDVAEELAGRARSVLGRDAGDAARDGGPNTIAPDELERRRKERAEHRAARRNPS